MINKVSLPFILGCLFMYTRHVGSLPIQTKRVG